VVTLVSSADKTDRHDISEKLLKVALNTITITLDPNELEVKDTTDTQKSASYLDLHLEIDNGGNYDKRDDFTFPIINFPLI
jgi:hypothetical protein